MASKLLLLVCLGFACIIYVRCQQPTGTLFGVASQSQYAVLRTYNINIGQALAAILGALVAQERLVGDSHTKDTVTVPTATLANGANGCPANWHLFNGFCYMLTTSTMNWLGTRDQCFRMGAYLADIKDQSEMNNLRDTILQPFNNEVFFFGLNDHTEEGNLFNDIVDEEPMFLNFIAGTLGIFGPGPGDCGVVLRDEFTMVPCVQAYRGICKRRQNSVLSYKGL